MISVIIPSYNSEKTIHKCLDSLLNQTYKSDYEIILIDSSDDNTPNIVSSNYPRIELTHLNQKTDPGTARNIGIKESKGNIIAFIDSDCIAAEDWLENIEEAHKDSYDVIGGAVCCANAQDDIVGWVGYIAEFREFLPSLSKREVEHIPTCNISYKKRIFNRFGMFKGEYYPQEDLVYNYNLRKNGERILYDPDIQVYHHSRSHLKNFLNHQKKIGIITAKVLKTIDLNGTFIVRNPEIAVILIPFLPIVKFIRTIIIFLRYQPCVIVRRPLVIFLFALGLFYWVIGFTLGTYKKELRL